MKRAAKIINKFGSPNCYLVSEGLILPFPTLELSNLFSRSKYYILPACLGNAWDFPIACQLAELVTAKAELAHITTRSACKLATAAQTHGR